MLFASYSLSVLKELFTTYIECLVGMYVKLPKHNPEEPHRDVNPRRSHRRDDEDIPRLGREERLEGTINK